MNASKHIKKSSQILKLFTLAWFSCGIGSVQATSTESFPLLSKSNFQYAGAFKFPKSSAQTNALSRALATITYNKYNNSLFIVGNIKQQPVAEFSIPKLCPSTTLKDLHEATQLQPFISIFEPLKHLNSQQLNRVSGMYVDNNKLLINALKYYDAAATNTHTSIVIDNSNELSQGGVKAFYSVQGAAHAAGWISYIPKEWQQAFSSSLLMGNASNTPIAARHSIGPSAFIVNDPNFVSLSPKKVSSTALIDFNLKNKLDDDFKNKNGVNQLWTVLSKAQFGFIVPNTRTYAVFGSSGGHHSKIGYKIHQTDNKLCAGHCAIEPNDYYNYYWLFNVDEMIKSFHQKILPHQIKPYEYGKLSIPFDTSEHAKQKVFHEISGGTYNAEKRLLYLSLKNADNAHKHHKLPIIVAYKVTLSSQN